MATSQGFNCPGTARHSRSCDGRSRVYFASLLLDARLGAAFLALTALGFFAVLAFAALGFVAALALAPVAGFFFLLIAGFTSTSS